METGNADVLIIEDQGAMRRALRDFLQAAYPAATIHEAHDGASALALCEGAQIRLVLTDLGLPDVNGIDLIPRIRALLPDSPVIVVSQRTEPVYAEKARDAGAFAFVSKDRIHRDLLPAVATALGGATERVPE